MNNEILNTIFSFITSESKKKRTPIIDIIDKSKYKLIVFTDATDTKQFINYSILTTDQQRDQFLSFYTLEGYIKYNNKRRWSIIIFKEDLKTLTENKFNMDTYIKGVNMIFNKITNNKITKYDETYYKDIIKYIEEIDFFKPLNF